MKKWLIGILCVMVVLIIALVAVLFNLGPVLTTAVNSYGPEVTQTKMHLGSANVSLFKGQASLDNFVLGNPEGFSTPNAITVGKVEVDVDTATLAQNPVIINRIEVIKPEITYEIKGKTDNFRTIINNIKKQSSAGTQEKKPEPGQQTPAEKQGGKKVVIRDFILKDVKLKTAAAIAGGDISTTTISEIHLRNIGEQKNGVEIAQALVIVLNELYTQVLSTDMIAPLKNRIKGYENQVKGVQEDMKSLGGQLKGLFQK